MRRTSARLAVVVSALAVTAPGIAAFICHPDPAGTSTLSLKGQVSAYALQGETVTVALRSGGACTTVAWNAASGKRSDTSATCGSLATPTRPAAPAGARLTTARGDRPDRLDVLGPGGRVTSSWPLPIRVRPGTLQVAGGLAAFVSRGAGGLWVTRLADGRTTFVAPLRLGDRPLLNTTGAAYQDNTMKNAAKTSTLLKFIPTRTLQHELAQVGRPVFTGGPIRSLSADGPRIALAVGGGANGCDRVVLWHVPWRFVGQISQQAGVTCDSSTGSKTISDVSLMGSRAQWLTLHRGRPMLVAADAIGCQEWVIRRLSDLSGRVSLPALASSGGMQAFAVVDRSSSGATSEIGLISAGYRGVDAFRLDTAARALAADGRRIAILGADGIVDVRTAGGRRIAAFAAPTATSLSLRQSLVAVTTSSGRLDVYSTRTGELVRSRQLPAGAGHVDLQYGIAVATAGRSVYAVDVSSGRVARLATAPRRATAQISSIGVVYAYSTATRGTAKLVPMSQVEQVLGR